MADKFKGLSSAEVERSRAEHGDNALRRDKKKGFFARFKKDK